MQIRACAAGDGWRWIKMGFALFRQNPALWIALMVMCCLLAFFLNLIPVVGGVLINLLGPVIMAGFMLGCRALEQGKALEINHLFAGFRHNTVKLITLGGIYLLAMILMFGLVFLTVGGEAFAQLGAPNFDSEQWMELALAVLRGLLVLLVLMTPVMMAYWFAPVLVVLDDLEPWPAMKMSFSACLRNMLPFLVYGLVCLAIMLLFSLAVAVISTVLMVPENIPLGLGLLVALPVLTASIYSSYRSIFQPG